MTKPAEDTVVDSQSQINFIHEYDVIVKLDQVFNHRTLDLESDVMLYTGFRTSFFKFWSRTRRHQ